MSKQSTCSDIVSLIKQENEINSQRSNQYTTSPNIYPMPVTSFRSQQNTTVYPSNLKIFRRRIFEDKNLADQWSMLDVDYNTQSNNILEEYQKFIQKSKKKPQVITHTQSSNRFNQNYSYMIKESLSQVSSKRAMRRK